MSSILKNGDYVIISDVKYPIISIVEYDNINKYNSVNHSFYVLKNGKQPKNGSILLRSYECNYNLSSSSCNIFVNRDWYINNVTHVVDEMHKIVGYNKYIRLYLYG